MTPEIPTPCCHCGAVPVLPAIPRGRDNPPSCFVECSLLSGGCGARGPVAGLAGDVTAFNPSGNVGDGRAYEAWLVALAVRRWNGMAAWEDVGGWTYSSSMLEGAGRLMTTALAPYAHPGEEPLHTLERLLGLDQLGEAS
jgi:hypothetical protein